MIFLIFSFFKISEFSKIISLQFLNLSVYDNPNSFEIFFEFEIFNFILSLEIILDFFSFYF